jgi:Flp pilus assembly protein TadG
MMKFLRLKRDDRGAAAIEMALALPILVSMIYGLFQVGLLYQANAGMQHALGEGARMATLYERYTSNNVPTDAAIKSRMTTKLFGKGDGAFTVADPVTGTGYKDLSITYSKKMNFIFFNGPTITLTRTKRAYTVS